MHLPTGEPKGPTWPWDVFRANDGIAPPNPARYGHTTKLAIILFGLVIFVALIAGPARSIETEMLTDVRSAKLAGFPQLPPGYASSARISDFIDQWNLDVPGSPSRQEIDALSDRVGEYEIDSALYNAGISLSVIAVIFVSAVAYSRALNNLRALGHEFALLAAAWAFAAWFIPIMNFIVPWKIVARSLQHAWRRTDSDSSSGAGGSRWAVLIAGLWGVVWIGFWLLNPFSIAMLMRTGDIDEWIRKIAVTELMMVWLPISMALNALVLAVISYRQRKRYRLLDSLSRGDVF